MANLLSPGVQVVEKDITQIVPKVSSSRGAFAGAFKWGPVNDPQLITNEKELVSLYGSPTDDTYTSFFTAANFLTYSNSMYVTRIDSGPARNAVAVASGKVSSVTLVSAGSGYTSVPDVIIGPPNLVDGEQAVGYATLAGGGVSVVNGTGGEAGNKYLDTALITTAGTGYTAGQAVVFSQPEQTVDTTDSNGIVTTTYVKAVGVVDTVNGSGGITRIRISNIGAGYTNQATILSIGGIPYGTPPSGGTALVHGDIPIVASTIKSVTITTAGSGYSSAPAIVITGNATGTAVVSPVGVKIRNQQHYDTSFSSGQANVGEVAAKYPSSMLNGAIFEMVDSGNWTNTLDGVFNCRNDVETFEKERELGYVRRNATSSSVTSFTSTITAGKVLRTGPDATVLANTTLGYQSYGNIEIGEVASVSTSKYYKVTIALPNYSLKNIQIDAPIKLSRSGAAAVAVGTFSGFVKEWDDANDQFEIVYNKFYIKITNPVTKDLLPLDVLTYDSTWKYDTQTSAATPSYKALGAVTSNGLILSQLISLTGIVKADVFDASCNSEWKYKKYFGAAPGTSDYVSKKGGLNDELHMILVDGSGEITGTIGQPVRIWEDVSKASDAKKSNGSSNYYREILNNSGYLWWMDHPSSVEGTAGKASWGSLALNSSFKNLTSIVSRTLSGGVDTGGMNTSGLVTAYALYNDSTAYDISLIPVGDVTATTAAWIINNVTSVRKDCVAFISPPLYVGTSSSIATSIVNYRNTINVGDVNASYAVMDSSWKYQFDRYSGKYRWVPMNGDIAGLCAYTDNVSDPWFSPGGYTRGQIKNVTKLAFNPTLPQRDILYQAGINPIVSFPGEGTILYGDKTMQLKASAFDRINVRRLFIVLEKSISLAAKYQLFEYNDDFTRAQFRNLVEPFLRDVQGRRGITDFKVKCDTSNNTPEVIDSNNFVADIYIKPNRSINYITLNFVATKTGVSFDSVGA